MGQKVAYDATHPPLPSEQTMKKLPAIALAALFTLPVTASHAQEWPKAKPITLTVAFAPGSSTDIVARLIGAELTKSLGTTVVVENKPGAGGNIATNQVKRAAPDGYALLIHSVAYAVNPSLYANAGYDALKDFAPVALGPRTPNIITIPAASQWKSLPDMVEEAKHGKLAYASSGIGTTTHLSMERLKTAAKVDITHVPFQPAAAITAVLGAQTPMASTSMPPAVPHLKAAKLRALAVTSAKRSPLLPDVPSITEFGYKDFDDYTWFGIVAPAGTPQAIVDKLNAEINRAMETAEVKQKFTDLGLEAIRNTPADFAAFLASEVPKWSGVVKASGAKVD